MRKRKRARCRSLHAKRQSCGLDRPLLLRRVDITSCRRWSSEGAGVMATVCRAAAGVSPPAWGVSTPASSEEASMALSEGWASVFAWRDILPILVVSPVSWLKSSSGPWERKSSVWGFKGSAAASSRLPLPHLLREPSQPEGFPGWRPVQAAHHCRKAIPPEVAPEPFPQLERKPAPRSALPPPLPVPRIHGLSRPVYGGSSQGRGWSGRFRARTRCRSPRRIPCSKPPPVYWDARGSSNPYLQVVNRCI
jgi:hypothetical protein